MRHGLEAVADGDALFQFAGKTFLKLNHLRTSRADEVMVMAVVAVAEHFVTRPAVAEIESLHDADFLQQSHRAINRRQITLAPRQRVMDLFVRQRARVLAQQVQDGLAWAGELVGFPPQTFAQLRQTRMRVSFHD